MTTVWDHHVHSWLLSSQNSRHSRVGGVFGDCQAAIPNSKSQTRPSRSFVGTTRHHILTAPDLQRLSGDFVGTRHAQTHAQKRTNVRSVVRHDLCHTMPDGALLRAMEGAMSHKQTILSFEIEKERIVPLKEAARLAGCSADTLKRNCRDKIIQISDRRIGMRVRDALMLQPEQKST